MARKPEIPPQLTSSKRISMFFITRLLPFSYIFFVLLTLLRAIETFISTIFLLLTSALFEYSMDREMAHIRSKISFIGDDHEPYGGKLIL